MAITAQDIKLMKSETLSDTDDGGGRMTKNEVQAGESNNLFPDTSSLDRVYGRMNMRKAFVAVQSANTDALLGANVIVAKKPDDPNIDVTLFSDKDWFNRRRSAQDSVEQYLIRGVSWAGHLLETQLKGQRSIQIACRPTDDVPRVDQCLYLVQNEGLASEFFQYCRVAKVESVLRTFTVQQKDVVRKVVTVEFTSQLRYTFEGISVPEYEDGGKPKARLRDTQVADIARYYAAKPLAKAAALNDRTLLLDSIYSRIVPTTQSETIINNVNAAGLKSIEAGAGAKIKADAGLGNNRTLTFGIPITKGTLLAYRDGDEKNETGHLVDKNGDVVYKTSGKVMGRVDYDKGVVIMNADFSGNRLYASADPARSIYAPTHTDIIKIEQDARGYSYIRTLYPKPTRGTLTISYEALGSVYYLYDNGRGELSGARDGVGSATLNYETGTVTLTTGALPDADSAILFAWQSNMEDFTRTETSDAWFAYKLPDDVVSALEGTIKEITVDGKKYAVGIRNIWDNTIPNTPAFLDRGNKRVYLNTTKFSGNVYGLMSSEVAYSYVTNAVRNQEAANRIIRKGSVYIALNSNTALRTIKRQEGNAATGNIYQEELTVLGMEAVRDDQNGNLLQNGVVVGTVNYTAGNITLDYTKLMFTVNYRQVAVEYRYFWKTAVDSNIGVQRALTATEAAALLETSFSTQKNESGEVVVSETKTGSSKLQPLGYYAVIPLRHINLHNVYGFEAIKKSNINEVYGYYQTASGFNNSYPLNEKPIYEGNGILYLGKNYFLPDYKFKIQVSYYVSGNSHAVSSLHFRAPFKPLRQGSVQLLFNHKGKNYTASPDAQGKIYDKNLYEGFVDYKTGVFSLKFGKYVADNEANRKQYKLTDEAFSDGKAWLDLGIDATTLQFNAVAYRNIPLNAELLGVDPVRLPTDGRVPVFRSGDVVVIHHTAKYPLSAPAASQSYNVGITQLAAMSLKDADGISLAKSMYSCDLSQGILTTNSSFSTAGLKLPLHIEYRFEDMSVVDDVQINGSIALVSPLSHDYPQENTLVSTALLAGDLQARAYNVFTKRTWSSSNEADNWADSTTDQVTAKYNTATHPIVMSNDGATNERWALIFSSSSSFRIVGEKSGQIGEGNINSETSPINPLTGKPYFTIPQGGWGGGWSSGLVLRFNTAAANYPIWIIRTVLPGAVKTANDKFCLLVRGDIDA